MQIFQSYGTGVAVLLLYLPPPLLVFFRGESSNFLLPQVFVFVCVYQYTRTWYSRNRKKKKQAQGVALSAQTIKHKRQNTATGSKPERQRDTTNMHALCTMCVYYQYEYSYTLRFIMRQQCTYSTTLHVSWTRTLITHTLDMHEYQALNVGPCRERTHDLVCISSSTCTYL